MSLQICPPVFGSPAHYAQRTARYAFGAAGDRQAADLGKYWQQWEKLEGRERQQAQDEEEDEGPRMR